MTGKLETITCVLVVATAILVGIVKCSGCTDIKAL
jgi:hypothetical protein